MSASLLLSALVPSALWSQSFSACVFFPSEISRHQFQRTNRLPNICSKLQTT